MGRELAGVETIEDFPSREEERGESIVYAGVYAGSGFIILQLTFGVLSGRSSH